MVGVVGCLIAKSGRVWARVGGRTSKVRREGVREKGAEQGVGLGLGLGLGLGSVWSRGVQQEGWECVRGGGGGSGAGWRQVDDWGLGGMGVF